MQTRIGGGQSSQLYLRFWGNSGLIPGRIRGVKSGLGLTTPFRSKGILNAISRADGSEWLVQAEAEYALELSQQLFPLEPGQNQEKSCLEA